MQNQPLIPSNYSDHYETNEQKATFGRFLRFWRSVRRLSQEQLAEKLDCSTRHLSRLETACSQPSLCIVMELCQALELGQRDTNHFRIAAGFAPIRKAVNFYSDSYSWLRKAMTANMRALEPYPTVLLDSSSNILMVNRPWIAFFSQLVSDNLVQQANNYFEFLFANDGVGAHLQDSENALAAVLMSLTQHYLFTNDAQDRELINNLKSCANIPINWKEKAASFEPMASYKLNFLINDNVLSFYSVMSSVGANGPAEYQSDPNISIHTFYPADDSLDLDYLCHQDLGHPKLYY